MNGKKISSRFLNKTTLQMIGLILIFAAAVVLLWHGNATSYQSTPAMTAQVYFDGEYRVKDGPWQKIVKGNHIPSTKGDVTLRGNFHMLTPDGEYVGLYTEDIPIAFYINHVSLTVFEGENEPFVIDMEDPMVGASLCGVSRTAYTLTGDGESPVEILIHNPHRFGNETAVDDLLANTALWTGIEFEKSVLARGETQREVGLFVIIVSLVFLGSALFSTLIHVKNSKILWIFGIVILFAGTYLTYSTDSISFKSESVVTNTTMLGCSMIFYMLFLSMTLVHFLKETKTVGKVTVSVLGLFDAFLFLLPVWSDVLFYDTWLFWTGAQILANCVLLACLLREFFRSKEKERYVYLGSILPLIAFASDAVMIGLGLWRNGLASQYVFFIFFFVAAAAVLKIIPNSINAVAKAKELENEKIALNAKLADSRISTMMSQIRPHFIYNTLGSIEQLCLLDPPKAGELVHNFAKYLRGNFGELDNPKPILMSREMEHVHHYVSIEKVRFPDMSFSFEMNSEDFHIPALTVQPLVENAIKHGLMKLQKGGSIRVRSYETHTDYCVLVEDDGVGFDPAVLSEERNRVGIRNIRGRLKAMVNGTLTIESEKGVGTKVLVQIPKQR